MPNIIEPSTLSSADTELVQDNSRQRSSLIKKEVFAKHAMFFADALKLLIHRHEHVPRRAVSAFVCLLAVPFSVFVRVFDCFYVCLSVSLCACLFGCCVCVCVC